VPLFSPVRCHWSDVINFLEEADYQNILKRESVSFRAGCSMGARRSMGWTECSGVCGSGQQRAMAFRQVGQNIRLYALAALRVSNGWVYQVRL
jgi:hypothetical protein